MVVELKTGAATDSTYSQVWRYVGWVRKFLAKKNPVKAIVVARRCESRFQLMAEASEGKVSFPSLSDLGYD